MFKTALAGWLWRRLWDWGGSTASWVGGLLAAWSLLPRATQDTIGSILQGHWDDVSISAAWGLGIWAISQVFSLRATVKPQVVTEDGNKAELKALPSTTRAVVNAQAETAVLAKKAQQPNLIDRLRSVFGR